jgi:crotonobetainyl-CoA:carnitine CoA-transferase CaiB-like acyl-CoA transferase
VRQLLDAIRVVELSGGTAGSYCAKLFADLGADVVKVESPSGDELRHRESRSIGPDGLFRGGAFLHLNSNKRSAIADLETADGQGLLDRLLLDADLVIETRGIGGASSWGLEWQWLHERRPSASVVAISGFGTTGPYASYRWSDLVVQTFSDALLRVRSDARPVRLPAQLGLCFVGNAAALGGLAAVLVAESSGTGCFVDCAAVEALATVPARSTTLLGHQYRDGSPAPSLTTAGRDTLIPMGVFPCRDGYVAMMSTPQQLQEMIDVLDNDDLRAAFSRPDAFERGETKEVLDAALYPWLLERTRAEVTAEAQRGGWPLAGVNSPSEVLEADHLHQRQFWTHADDPGAGAISLPGPPCRFSEGGWSLRGLAPSLGEHTREVSATLSDNAGRRRRENETDTAGGWESGRIPPLRGVRVVDMTTVWSGPYATMLLADLGAEVIRVENPWVLPPTTKGYHARPVLTNPGALGSLYGPPVAGRPDRPWNRHAMNNCLARNKLSCTIDIRRPEGRELLMRLVERSDVFIENFKSTGLARLGIQTSELQSRNPRLLIIRMPPTGTTGDWSGYTGFGAQFDGLTSMLWLCGHLGAELVESPGTTYMDAASGPGCAFATLAALRYRSRTQRGQVVEFAQSENILNHLGDVFVDCQLGVEPQRWGNRDPWLAPQGLYRCRDDELIAISVDHEGAWRALLDVVGRSDLIDDPRYSTPGDRRDNHRELDTIIECWTSERSAREAFHALQSAGIAAAPLLDDTQFAADPHIRARDWLRTLHSLDVGSHLHPGTPYRGVPHDWRRGSPILGEDNEYVYKKVIGVSDAEYARYREEKILGEDYLDPTGTPY